MAVIIRPAVLADVEGVRAVGYGAWPPTYGPIAGDDYVARGLQRWWSVEVIAALIESGNVLVAVPADTADGAPIGIAGVQPDGDVLILRKLYVHPEFQRTGAGSALLDEVVSIASHAFTAVRLEHMIGNERAGRFYAARGFVAIGTDVDPIGGPGNVLMERKLP